MSTTHTTVGAVVGMSLVLQGAGAVNWNSRTDAFPYFSGISTIVSSWCDAPALAQARAYSMPGFAHCTSVFAGGPQSYVVMAPCGKRWRRRFISPICSAIILSIIFGLVRTFVLRSQHSFRRAFYVLPFFVMLTFFIIAIFILQTNNKSLRCAPSLPASFLANQGTVVLSWTSWDAACFSHLPRCHGMASHAWASATHRR